jgi:hypothetical protein
MGVRFPLFLCSRYCSYPLIVCSRRLVVDILQCSFDTPGSERLAAGERTSKDTYNNTRAHNLFRTARQSGLGCKWGIYGGGVSRDTSKQKEQLNKNNTISPPFEAIHPYVPFGLQSVAHREVASRQL